MMPVRRSAGSRAVRRPASRNIGQSPGRFKRGFAVRERKKNARLPAPRTRLAGAEEGGVQAKRDAGAGPGRKSGRPADGGAAREATLKARGFLLNNPPMSQRVKKWLPLTLQTLVSAALLAWIFRDPSFRAQVGEVFTSARPGWLLAGFAAAGVGNLIGVVRWGIFLRVLKITLSGWDTLRMSLVGLFFNNFLVGAAGGDAVKVVWVASRGNPKAAALVSVLMDRMSGLGALVLCSVFFMLWRFDWLMRSHVVAGLIQFVFGYLIVVVGLLALTFFAARTGLSERLPAAMPGREKIREFSRVYLLFVQAWRETLLAATLSGGILVAHFLTFYCSARAFDAVIPLPDFFAFMPAVDVISALPVSVGGLGVREQLFVTVLGQLCGVPADRAFSISIAGAMLAFLWGLVGLACLPSYRGTRRAAE